MSVTPRNDCLAEARALVCEAVRVTNAAAHLQAADLTGAFLIQPQALTAGALLFGDLLQPGVEAATGTSESGGPTTDHCQVAG